MSLPTMCRSAGQKRRKLVALGVGIAHGGEIVGERVEPDIHDVLGIARHRDAPGEAGARDRQIVEAAADEAHHLVAARARRDEVGIALVMREQPLLPRRQAEEIIFLLHPFDFGAGRRLAVEQFALVEERLVAHRIPAGELAEIDFAAALQLVPQRLARADVARLGGADEIVVGDVHELRHGAEILRHAVAEFLRVDPRGRAPPCRPSGRARRCR